MSRILGLSPIGVKRKPTVKRNYVPLYERRKPDNWSILNGLAATEVIIWWQSRYSSQSQGKLDTRRRTTVIVRDESREVERTKTYVRYHQNPA